MGGPGEAGREMSRVCLWCRCVWSREGLDALPGGLRAGKQALLLGADTMAPLFTVVGRSSSVRRMLWGGLPGGRQGHRDALPDTGLQPALSVGERERKISSLVVNSPGKCAKKRHWHCLENQGNVSLDLNSRRKQKVFIVHSYAEGGLAGGGKPGSVQVYVGYCAKRNYEVSQKGSLERCMALTLIKADVTCVPRQVIPTCP